jgi:hypothetical protein
MGMQAKFEGDVTLTPIPVHPSQADALIEHLMDIEKHMWQWPIAILAVIGVALSSGESLVATYGPIGAAWLIAFLTLGIAGCGIMVLRRFYGRRKARIESLFVHAGEGLAQRTLIFNDEIVSNVLGKPEGKNGIERCIDGCAKQLSTTEWGMFMLTCVVALMFLFAAIRTWGPDPMEAGGDMPAKRNVPTDASVEPVSGKSNPDDSMPINVKPLLPDEPKQVVPKADMPPSGKAAADASSKPSPSIPEPNNAVAPKND